MSTTPTLAPKTAEPERGHAWIDHAFVLLATAVVLGGLGFAAYFALSINQSMEGDQIAVSGHGNVATILGILLSLALGILLTVIFVRGRKREAEEDARPRR